MKQIIKQTALSLFGMLLFAFNINAQTVTLKPGSKLIYGVDFQGKKYDFTVTIKKMKPTVEFEYEMTAPANKKGKVTISAKDMDSARELYNYFAGGNITLKGQTTVFLSRKVFEEILENDGSTFKPNTDAQAEKFSHAVRNTSHYIINGKELEVETEYFDDLTDINEGAHNRFTVLRNKNCPLILYMDMGWSISLKEMKNVDYVKKEE